MKNIKPIAIKGLIPDSEMVTKNSKSKYFIKLPNGETKIIKPVDINEL